MRSVPLSSRSSAIASLIQGGRGSHRVLIVLGGTGEQFCNIAEYMCSKCRTFAHFVNFKVLESVRIGEYGVM